MDSYALREQVPDVMLSLMTPCRVRVERPGELVLEPGDQTSARACVQYDAGKLQVEMEDIPIEDGRLRSVWGDALRRIVLRAEGPPLEDTWMLRVRRRA